MMYARGTLYSREHDVYEATQEEFWDFTWEEIGTKDAAAAIDYVHNLTGKKVNMTGYSMGTTNIFSALAMRYEYFEERTDKVALFAPCTVTDGSMYPWYMFNPASIKILEEKNIFEIGGPTWP